MACLSRAPTSVRVAVPYIGKVHGFRTIESLSQFLLRRECGLFQLITLPPESAVGAIQMDQADRIARMGVEVMIRNRLHSKIYQFTFPQGDRAAFVGSANLTAGGFERNVETVAFFRQKEHNDAVARELDRIAGYGAVEYAHWKIHRGIVPKEQ